MKLLIPLFIFLVGITCNDSAPIDFKASVHIPKTETIKGLNFVAPPDPYPNNPMEAVVDLGASWVAVIPYAYTRYNQPKVHYNTSNWQWWGERPEGVRKTIELAKSSNIKVILKPQVYVPRSWTGNLEFSDNEWENWEKDYESYIMPFAKMADSLDVEVFCVGTEFKKSVNQREHFWRALIQKIRAVYKGKLTYAANWDEYEQVPFWDALDLVGINAYFPLTKSKTPTLAELKKAWLPYRKQIRRFYSKVKKPIVFTEYGYLSVDGCAYNTWELEGKVKKLRINQEAQANAINALFEVFWEEPYWHGGFLWKWFPNMRGGEGYDERDYTPQGKKGETVLKEWFNGS